MSYPNEKFTFGSRLPVPTVQIYEHALAPCGCEVLILEHLPPVRGDGARELQAYFVGARIEGRV